MDGTASSARITSVAAFIDWNAQLLLTRRDAQSDPEGAAETAFRHTTRRIARCLDSIGPDMRFRVAMRLYHGWHKGYEPTANRKAAQLVVARADYAALSQRPNVVFSPNVEFGDKLALALDRRLHLRLGIHLPNTVRKRPETDLFQEKMVDTALVADVVTTAHRDAADWILVVTEDDDLVPAIYVAEAVLARTNARVILLRQRSQPSLLKLDDLLRAG